jgi:hypothetical protein
MKLLSMRSYSTAALTGFCFFAAQPSIFVLCQIYFQRGLHFSPLEASLATMPTRSDRPPRQSSVPGSCTVTGAGS